MEEDLKMFGDHIDGQRMTDRLGTVDNPGLRVLGSNPSSVICWLPDLRWSRALFCFSPLVYKTNRKMTLTGLMGLGGHRRS